MLALWLSLALAATGGGIWAWRAGRGRHRRQQEHRFFQDQVLEPGASIVVDGRFAIEELVQEGGMGMVYRARDRQSGQEVALKLVRRPGLDQVGQERFARETRILAGLDHPRIARYVAHGSAASGQAYLAMSWLAGEDLRAALDRGPLTLADSLLVLTGAAEALAQVHGQGIVHRDLKPGNIFLRDRSADQLVLLDFGLARQERGEPAITRTAALVGTPQYMAPEQAASSPQVLPATDIFALGCIFYECLAGRPAFAGAQMLGVLAGILFDQPQAIETIRPAVPAAWAVLLGRMLRKQAGQRPADGAALLRELRTLPPAPAAQPGEGPGDALADPMADPLAVSVGARDSGDQVLVSVVLATLPGALPANPTGFEAVRAAMSRFHCPIERLLDGSILATILPPHGATDQALIAARCALSLRELWPQARVAVATGKAPLGPGARVGEAVDRAARMVDSVVDGGGAGIHLDSLTANLLDARFITRQKNGQILLLGEDLDRDESRPLLGKPTPCVGREVELGQLESLMSRVVEDAVPRAAVVTGPPGIGKSRLRHELLRRLRGRYPDATILVGYGDPLSAGSPYVIVSDALRRHGGIGAGEPPDSARGRVRDQLCGRIEPSQRGRVGEFLGEVCGIPFPDQDSPPLRAARGDDRVMSEQIALAFADWLAAQCAAGPVLLVLEDLQWGDAVTVKLLEGAMREVKEGALLLLALARPELEDSFPNFLAGQRAVSLALQPLSTRASELLVKEVLGEAIAPASLTQLVRMAAGNALFLEELIRTAADGPVGEVPQTVVAILQARLSRLAPEARQVLRAGSLFGESFWPGAASRVCAGWGASLDVDAWLGHLVQAEVLARRRSSRFPGEVEYAVRHQLVCEAATGLSTAADTREGRRAAGRWLQEMGEADGIVLARHAREGQEPERAIPFFTQAAEQSMAQHDFAEALARADQGMACAAAGEALGVLLSLRASALYSLARWLEAAEVGLTALPLLPAGGVWWCGTVEKLFQVLPNIGQLERYQQLADQMMRTPPGQGAEQAFVRALHVQLLAYAISGRYAKGEECLAFIDRVAAGASERDVVDRGYRRLWQAIFQYILGDDLPQALRLVEQAKSDLAESQVMYRLSLACCLHCFVWWGLGDLQRSESAARQGRATAQAIGDNYHAAQSTWYLGLALCEQTDPGKLDEAEACAQAVMDAHISPIYDSFIPRVITARVAVTRQDWPRAEAEARIARGGLVGLTPFVVMASTDLVIALLGQGRAGEAAAVVQEDLPMVEAVGGPMCSEVAFNVAGAEAMHLFGDREMGERLLRRALEQIERRAAKMAEPEMRKGFLTLRRENRRAFALRGQWGLAG